MYMRNINYIIPVILGVAEISLKQNKTNLRGVAQRRCEQKANNSNKM